MQLKYNPVKLVRVIVVGPFMSLLRNPFVIPLIVAFVASLVALIVSIVITYGDFNDAAVPDSIWGHSLSDEFRDFVRERTTGLYPFLRSGFRSPLPASTNRLELKSRQKQPLQKLQIPQRRSRQAIPTTKGRKQGLSLRRLHRDEAGIFQHVPFLDRNETGAYEKATAGSVHSCK